MKFIYEMERILSKTDRYVKSQKGIEDKKKLEAYLKEYGKPIKKDK